MMVVWLKGGCLYGCSLGSNISLCVSSDLKSYKKLTVGIGLWLDCFIFVNNAADQAACGGVYRPS